MGDTRGRAGPLLQSKFTLARRVCVDPSASDAETHRWKRGVLCAQEARRPAGQMGHVPHFERRRRGRAGAQRALRSVGGPSAALAEGPVLGGVAVVRRAWPSPGGAGSPALTAGCGGSVLRAEGERGRVRPCAPPSPGPGRPRRGGGGPELWARGPRAKSGADTPVGQVSGLRGGLKCPELKNARVFFH